MIFYGAGIVNSLINKLPFEFHLPGYQFCGPGTNLKKRLARGDLGINPLDSACKQHDIAYSQNPENIEKRNEADKVLAEQAWQRVFAKDSSLGERAAAYSITNIMKAKSKLGMGMKRKRMKVVKKKINFKTVVGAARKSMDKKTKNARLAIKSALSGARSIVKRHGKKNVKIPKIITLPKVGNGIWIPILAGLSALGAITGGVAGVVSAVNTHSDAQRNFEEAERHNRTMESIAMGKGLYLNPYRTGSGAIECKIATDFDKKKYQEALAKKKSSYPMNMNW